MRIPKHIGIIPDGNRRWAKESGKEKEDGYDFGIDPGFSVYEEAKKLGCDEITFYGFTTDNCKRPKAQIEKFTEACIKAVEKVATTPSSILVCGNYDSKMFPEELKKYKTRQDVNGGGMKVNFLVNYGWEWDLSKTSDSNLNNNRNKIISSLQSSDISKIDLIIRWGGHNRLSGFLPIQSVYSDLYITDNMWPDYKKEDLINAIKWYDVQDVTLGG